MIAEVNKKKLVSLECIWGSLLRNELRDKFRVILRTFLVVVTIFFSFDLVDYELNRPWP